MIYYNTKTQRFEKLKSKTKTTYKILIDYTILRDKTEGRYGPDELTGQYYSIINGVTFLWDDPSEDLIEPVNYIRVYYPENPWRSVVIHM
jgi:hypothetical protein